MTSLFDPSLELSNEEATLRIRHILSCGTAHFSNHARGRMQSRNFTDQDVIHILETGNISDKEYNDSRGNWKYKVSGMDIDGEEGIIVTAVLDADNQLIITVF